MNPGVAIAVRHIELTGGGHRSVGWAAEGFAVDCGCLSRRAQGHHQFARVVKLKETMIYRIGEVDIVCFVDEKPMCLIGEEHIVAPRFEQIARGIKDSQWMLAARGDKDAILRVNCHADDPTPAPIGRHGAPTVHEGVAIITTAKTHKFLSISYLPGSSTKPNFWLMWRMGALTVSTWVTTRVAPLARA